MKKNSLASVCLASVMLLSTASSRAFDLSVAGQGVGGAGLAEAPDQTGPHSLARPHPLVPSGQTIMTNTGKVRVRVIPLSGPPISRSDYASWSAAETLKLVQQGNLDGDSLGTHLSGANLAQASDGSSNGLWFAVLMDSADTNFMFCLTNMSATERSSDVNPNRPWGTLSNAYDLSKVVGAVYGPQTIGYVHQAGTTNRLLMGNEDGTNLVHGIGFIGVLSTHYQPATPQQVENYFAQQSGGFFSLTCIWQASDGTNLFGKGQSTLQNVGGPSGPSMDIRNDAKTVGLSVTNPADIGRTFLILSSPDLQAPFASWTPEWSANPGDLFSWAGRTNAQLFFRAQLQ